MDNQKMETENLPEDVNNDTKNISTSSKESECENVDAIKKFIEDEEKKIQDQKDKEPNIKDPDETISKDEPNIENIGAVNEDQQETLAVASSVMNMILSESEARISKKQDIKIKLAKSNLNPGEKANSSVSLSVGSKVEAKDYGEFWYPAQIVEVDYDEMEVLVHYENVSKKHDEWISVSSPRLRPIGSTSKNPDTPTAEATSSDVDAPIKEEPKAEEKPKLLFAVGERCLARWRDNRRFIATVKTDLGNGSYEVVFDDGFQWTCKLSRLYKLKESMERNNDSLNIDTSSPSAASTPSPVPYGAGPSNMALPTAGLPQTPAYHKHLFDPTRDYLGSKSERREMKRKLNIKEIFNIGQKRRLQQKSPKDKGAKRMKIERKPKIVKVAKSKPADNVQVDHEVKKEIPDAVASIIGTVGKDQSVNEEAKSDKDNAETIVAPESKQFDIGGKQETLSKETPETSKKIQENNPEVDPVVKEEVKLEKFENLDDEKHEQVIDKIKEVIIKLEDGLSKVEKVDSPKPIVTEDTVKPEEITDIPVTITNTSEPSTSNSNGEKVKKNLTKIKKSKKLRLLQEKKVKRQVEKVKSELEEMKKQVEEMRKQMLMKTEELSKSPQKMEMPESFLLPGEWCCKWVNGQPVGTVSEVECEVKVDSNNKPGLPRRSVQVEDKRLPPGWTKHMVRRSLGHSAGKWDVVLISPDNRRFHTKTDMRSYLESSSDETLKAYEYPLLDFGVHLKLSRRMGWVTTEGGADSQVVPLPVGLMSSTSPLVKRRKLGLKKKSGKMKEKKKRRMKLAQDLYYDTPGTYESPVDSPLQSTHLSLDASALEDGYVYVGSLKVQIIENLLRCPAEGCYKNFRNNTLLQMHIKHYHRELRKMMGATPKVLDLASARTTMPAAIEMPKQKSEPDQKIKVKITKPPKRVEEPKSETKDVKNELKIDVTPTNKHDGDKTPRPQDSPKLRNALTNKPVKRPRVLLPVRRVENTEPAALEDVKVEDTVAEDDYKETTSIDIPNLEELDFETAISTHTVTKPLIDKKKKGDKKGKSFATISKKAISEDDEWYGMNSDVDTRSSFPRSGTPDSKNMDVKMESLPQLASSESNEDQKVSNLYMYTETGERIKIVHMKREEIINCHCGFREEDGLMVQCELCLCWQHALCHNIQKESEVPEKYTCSICLNPRRGRRSQRFLHDQDRLYEGLLPGAKPCDSLRRSHELSGNLHRIEDALHALRVKYYVATKKDHPKLYLWAKDWENGEISLTQEKLNTDYSDLHIMINNIGKENLPVKPDEVREMDIRSPPSEEQDGERLGSHALLGGLLASPGGALDLPISTSELERLAKSVQEQESRCVVAPQPEAAIEDGACRERLLRHVRRAHALLDARLDSIEAQVAELESQDPSFEDDETADYFPRTKQTIQMLLRDLDTMEELGVIT